MSVQNSPTERQIVPKHQPEDTITRVARTIFDYRYPTKEWNSNLFKSEREDCFLLAYQFKEVFADKWTLFDATEKLTEQSTRLLFGDREIPPVLRAQVHDYCESFFEDLVKLFMGDGLTILKNPLAGICGCGTRVRPPVGQQCDACEATAFESWAKQKGEVS